MTNKELIKQIKENYIVEYIHRTGLLSFCMTRNDCWGSIEIVCNGKFWWKKGSDINKTMTPEILKALAQKLSDQILELNNEN